MEQESITVGVAFNNLHLSGTTKTPQENAS
jgi:hypothetical protein